MSYIPTVEQARELVMRYNKEPFHLQHAETVSKVMGEIANGPNSTASRPTSCFTSWMWTRT